MLRSLVLSLDGRPVPLDSASKALYHAAACAASNYLVTLVDYAACLMVKAGVPPDVAMPALLPLVAGTVENLETVGLPDALTGPIARGDVGTVKGHLAALQAAPGDLVRLYVALARKTVEVAAAEGTDRARDRGRAPRPPARRGAGTSPCGSPGTGPRRPAGPGGRRVRAEVGVPFRGP